MKDGLEIYTEFSVKEIKKAEKHLKTYSTSLAIREFQIKATLRISFTPVIMTKINNTHTVGCGIKESQSHCWWEYKLLQPYENQNGSSLEKWE